MYSHTKKKSHKPDDEEVPPDEGEGALGETEGSLEAPWEAAGNLKFPWETFKASSCLPLFCMRVRATPVLVSFSLSVYTGAPGDNFFTTG